MEIFGEAGRVRVRSALLTSSNTQIDFTDKNRQIT